jgi:hypothetical protein
MDDGRVKTQKIDLRSMSVAVHSTSGEGLQHTHCSSNVASEDGSRQPLLSAAPDIGSAAAIVDPVTDESARRMPRRVCASTVRAARFEPSSGSLRARVHTRTDR